MEEMKEGENLTIRKLTERECMRLMDYSDEEIDRLTEAVDARGRRVFSKSAIYRFAGNSIVVGCLEGVLEGCVAEWGEAPLKKGLDRWL